MVSYMPVVKDSPDRMDALVHAVRWLMAQEKRSLRMASPQQVDVEFSRLMNELNLT